MQGPRSLSRAHTVRRARYNCEYIIYVHNNNNNNNNNNNKNNGNFIK